MLLAIGDVAVDVYATVPQLPHYGEKLRGEQIGMFGGGVAANFACAAARYGADAALIGAVGDDFFGRVALEETRRDAVDVSHVAIRPGTTTSWNFVAVGRSGEKALTILPTENFFPRCEWVDLAPLGVGRHAHLAPFDVVEALRFAKSLGDAGLTLSLDLEPAMIRGASVQAIRELVELADVVSVNEHAYADLLGTDEPEHGVRALRELGPNIVIVTLGAQGSVLATSDDVFRVECVPPVAVVDTTGAGDCYNAIFLAAWIDGAEPADAAALASTAASLSLGAFGSRTAYPTAEAVRAVGPAAVRRLGR